MTTQTKICQNCKQNFTIEPDDFSFYEKISVPPPTWCPECRMKRRAIWRNEKNLFRRTCDATGKSIFTMFHPEAQVKVYDRDYWWSDAWNPLDYGRDYDFSKSFFEQIGNLIKEVPWPSRSAVNLENSEYCMNCADLKNCYLTFGAGRDENCYYSVGLGDSKDSYDILLSNQMELCYDCFYSENDFQSFYSFDIDDCRNVILCKSCRNCTNCFGCVGLVSKQYYIFNEPYSKVEYEEKIKSMQLHTYSGLQKARKKFQDFQLRVPVKYMTTSRSVDVSGDYIFNSKNVKESYVVDGSEDLKYCQNLILAPYAKNSYDYSFFGRGAELVYESSSVGINSAGVRFSHFAYPSTREVEYSLMCPSSEHIFGCVNMRKKSYCILNKQYSKEEYNNLVKKIKKHMTEMPFRDSKGREYSYGEGFPFDLCPIAYNESSVQEWAPLTKLQAKQEGIVWRDSGEKKHAITKNWNDLPDSINDANDTITQEIILCKYWDENSEKAQEHNCSMAFKILPQELQFYKRFGLPLPRKCFNSRHYDRTQIRNLPKNYHRSCDCAGQKSKNNRYLNTANIHNSHKLDQVCPNEFETSYSPDRPEIVYCEQCYQQEVV